MWNVTATITNKVSSPNKYLIIAPAWIGDMVMAQALIRFLKQRDPQANIDVVAPISTYPLLKLMPEVDGKIEVDLPHGQLNLIKRWHIAKQLRKKYYTHAIVLPNSFKSALIPWLAKIPQRRGWLGEQRYFLLNDSRRLNKTIYQSMLERFIALGMDKNAMLPTLLPWPKLTVSATLLAQTKIKFLNDTPQPLIALCPGAEFGPAKRWPVTHFAQLATLLKAKGYQPLLLGGPNDSESAAAIQQLSGESCLNLVGLTTLSEVAALLSLTDIVVTNDSGLMHIAAALDKKIVAIYGSSSAQFTPPLAENVKILSLNLDCSPCFQRTCPLSHYHCLMQLLPPQVLAAIEGIKK